MFCGYMPFAVGSSLIIDHDKNETPKFSIYNRMKNSEAVKSWRWQLFHIVMILTALWANTHFAWNADGRAVFFMAAIGSLYLAGILIALRDGFFRLVGSK